LCPVVDLRRRSESKTLKEKEKQTNLVTPPTEEAHDRPIFTVLYYRVFYSIFTLANC